MLYNLILAALMALALMALAWVILGLCVHFRDNYALARGFGYGRLAAVLIALMGGKP